MSWTDMILFQAKKKESEMKRDAEGSSRKDENSDEV
jgi:hypothetical protein